MRQTTGQQGWADVWMRGHFGWEYKRKRRDLRGAYQQLLLYREDLENPPLLIVCGIARRGGPVVRPGNMRRHRRSVAEEAQRALRSIQVRDDIAAIAAVEAARRDYDVLLQAYDENDKVIIGDPVDCFHGEGEE